MPQNPQNKISQTALKNYDQFRRVRTESLRWIQITTHTGINSKLKQQKMKEINNYWNSLPFMYLKLNGNILQIRTS